MSIRLLNKNSVIKGILISGILTTQLSAFGLKINNPLGKEISNINSQLNSQLSSLTSALNSLGIKLNLTCLLPTPHFSLGGSLGGGGSFSLCHLKNNFSFKIGPCAGSLNLSSNPLYSRISNICQGGNIVSTISVGMSGIAVSAGLDSGADFKKIKYTSGLTYATLYGDKKGKTPSLVVSMTKTHPNSQIAKDFYTNDKEALITETFLLKKTGTDKPSKAKLPKNKALFNKQVNDNAKIFKQSIPNKIDIISQVQRAMTSSYVLDDIKNSDGTINYTKYFQNFKDFVKGDLTQVDPDKTIPKLYKTIHSAIDYEYSLKLMILKANSKYFEYAPTQSAMQLIPYEKRRKFLYNSLIWTAQKTLLEGQKQKAIAKADEDVRVTLRKTYIASKPFDSVAAKQELKRLLQ